MHKMTARVFGTYSSGTKAGKVNPRASVNIQTTGNSIAQCSQRIHTLAAGAPYQITSKS